MTFKTLPSMTEIKSLGTCSACDKPRWPVGVTTGIRAEQRCVCPPPSATVSATSSPAADDADDYLDAWFYC